MVLVAVLTIALPGSTEAAGRGSAVQSGDVWGLVVSWLSDLWSGVMREPVGGAAGYSSVLDNSSSAGSAGSPSGTTTSSVCQGDQGVCIDPNG
jgi:hypothetical protein